MRNPLRALFETRNIASSAELLRHLLGGSDTLSGARVSETTAYNVAAVATCISIRSRSLSTLPIHVYERLDARRKQPAPQHPLARLLMKPNGWQTRAECFGMLEAHRCLRGNGYAWKNLVTVPSRDGVERLQTEELIPLHPDRVEVEQLADWSLKYTLHRRSGGKLELPAAEVLHLRGLTTDGVLGRSVLQDAREAIGGAIATQEHANLFWQKDGTPSVVLTHPQTLSDKAKNGIEESWEKTYGGSKGKRRVAVLEEGMTMTPLSMTAQDSQFLETRKFQRSEIAGWFHVPPHMIGDTEKSTSWGTGIEQQQIGFLVFTLRPDLVSWEQRLTLDLIQRPEKFFIEFSIEGFFRGDSAGQAMFFRTMREVGAMSANDIREKFNWNPIEGGDTYLQPTNLAPLGSNPLAPTKGAAE